MLGEEARARLREDALTSGELGAVAAQTVQVTLLPVLLSGTTSSALALGAAVGGEGIFALALPFWSGALSDRIRRPPGARVSGRMVVVGAAALLLAAATAVTPLLSGYLALAGAAFVAFAALHAYLTPFWALTLDAVPDDRRGRVQGTRGLLRSLGLAYGLVAAGLLYGIARPLPFLVAGALVLVTTALTGAAAGRQPPRHGPEHRPPLGEAWRALLANRPALWLLGADACWNASVDGIRPYVFLYARQVLGTTVSQTSVGLVVLVVALGGGSWVIGRLGDRYDRLRLLELASIALALALAAGFLIRGLWAALAVAAAAGLAASAIMTLPLPLYANLVGDRQAGENTGLYVVSVTIGRVGAPLLVGGAVDLSARWQPRTHGYPAMWLVASALAAAGWACVRRAARARPRRPVRTQLGEPHPSRSAPAPEA